jgi:hypothetical protein
VAKPSFASLGFGLGVAGAFALAVTSALAATGNPPPPLPQSVEVPYNGDLTFTRIRYGEGFGRSRGGGNWAHDYPSADRNMQLILTEFTSMRPNTRGSNVLDLEDPEIFRHPILYMSEPGFWRITSEGAANLREHLLKGGFIIFDDFDGYGHWESWESQILRALPEYRPIEIFADHPVFDSFFFIQDIYVPHPFASVKPQYFGIFEDNDPTQRMLALVNYNGDLAEYWEYATEGFFPVDPTSDAFRLGVNYFIYGVTR